MSHKTGKGAPIKLEDVLAAINDVATRLDNRLDSIEHILSPL
jgi:hypothetical protein